jgi:hypothetical protein
MLKARRFLTYRPRHMLLAGLLPGLILFAGCFSSDFSPSYKEAEIGINIQKICLEECKLKVIPLKAGNTLWIYAPQQRILHAQFGKVADKVFDEELIDKVRNILNSISRVCLSADKSPEFFVLALSDINLGLDYSLTANISDIKRSTAGGVPWTEANKRYVINFELAPNAVGDQTGEHLKIFDIKMADFLSLQIAQRVRMFFQDSEVKKAYTLKEADAAFKYNKFIFNYSVVRISEPKEKIDIAQEILNIITYCFKTYEFKDFEEVEIRDLLGDQSSFYQRGDILSRSIE